MDQFDMHFEETKPEVNDREVQLLCETLLHAGCWMASAQIIAKHGMANTEQSRRVLRAMAMASKGSIISGSMGYKHNAHATLEERVRVIGALKSQAEKMHIEASFIELFAEKNGLN